MSQSSNHPPTMSQHPHWSAECAYLDSVNNLLQHNIDRETKKLAQSRQDLLDVQSYVQENMASSAADTDKGADTSQYLNILNTQAASYQVILQKLKQYKLMQGTPYFGRIDFVEQGSDREAVYIGRGTLMDQDKYEIKVYDWRSPIASIFYRAGLGKAAYKAPDGEISGEVLLKRQYEIHQSKLHFFFDTELNIKDQMLVQALSQNASPQMKDIVETIQKEQDVIIRDVDSDLLMVQGTAGSGKTSVALHRVAYLMYQALAKPLVAHNVILISPNEIFSQYISQVLPDLGEEKINNLTFDLLIAQYLSEGQQMLSKAQQTEILLCSTDPAAQTLDREIAAFKTSTAFCTLLERLAWHYEHKVYRFPDIYHNNKYLANRQELKAELMRDRKTVPFTKRLSHIKERLLEKIHLSKKERLPELELFVTNYPDHQLEIRAFARLLSYKNSAGTMHAIQQLDQIDFSAIYSSLWQDRPLFYRLAKGLKLPPNIDEILAVCQSRWNPQLLNYEDGAGIAYLRILLEGTQSYLDIKQVVVDEVQDYGPLHFALLQHWFPKARYTVLGDVEQTVASPASLSLYEDIKNVLNKPKSTLAVLKQSFRNSYEISAFSSQFLNQPDQVLHFQRHGTAPAVFSLPDQAALDQKLINQIKSCRAQGHQSIAIICKTMAQASALVQRIRHLTPLRLITENSTELGSGTLVLPIYLAKGLEFDAVLLYQTTVENYQTPEDRRLLYIASTRALHHLSLFYSGEISPLINTIS